MNQPWNNRSKRGSTNQHGFTLLEMIVVVAIIGLFLAVGIPAMGSLSGKDMKVASREISEEIRAAYDEAFLHNKSFRVVWNLDRNGYWIEVADDEARIFRSEEERQDWEEFQEDYERVKERLKDDKERELERQKSQSLLNDSDDGGLFGDLFAAMFTGSGSSSAIHPADYQDINGFVQAPGFAPKPLPDGVFFSGFASYAYEDVLRPSDEVPEEPTDEVRASTVIFPTGYIEDTVVYLSDGDREWSLVIEPLTGRVTVHGEVVPLPKYDERVVEE